MGIRKRETATFVSIVLSCFVLLAGVAGCGTLATKPDTDEGKRDANISEKKGGTITVAIGSEPDTLDVHKSTALSTEAVALNLGGLCFTETPKHMRSSLIWPNRTPFRKMGRHGHFAFAKALPFMMGHCLLHRRTSERLSGPCLRKSLPKA